MMAEEIVRAYNHWAKDTKGPTPQEFNAARRHAFERYVQLAEWLLERGRSPDATAFEQIVYLLVEGAPP